MELKGKHALVTGGASGIGLESVKELLKAGVSKCAILDFNSSLGEKAENDIAAEYGKDRVMFAKCDVTNKDTFEDAVKAVKTVFGSLDIFVNNAGMVNEDEHWDKAVQTNLSGVIMGCVLAIKYMGENYGGRGGTVVNVASILGLVPAPCWPVYSATKHGIIGYTRSLGSPTHLKKSGVKVMVLCPGPTITDLLRTGAQNVAADLESSMSEMIGDHGKPQEAATTAKALIDVLKQGENGSIWVVDSGNPPYEVEIPDYKDMRKKK